MSQMSGLPEPGKNPTDFSRCRIWLQLAKDSKVRTTRPTAHTKSISGHSGTHQYLLVLNRCYMLPEGALK